MKPIVPGGAMESHMDEGGQKSIKRTEPNNPMRSGSSVLHSMDDYDSLGNERPKNHSENDISLHFINKSLLGEINKVDEKVAAYTSLNKKKWATANRRQDEKSQHVQRDDKENNSSHVFDKSTKSQDQYYKKLRYLPNNGFGHYGSFIKAPVSIPNTFKHKSHPNAKTKTQIGLGSIEGSLEEANSLDNSSASKDKTGQDANNIYGEDNLKYVNHSNDGQNWLGNLSREKENHSTSQIRAEESGEIFNSTPEWMPAELTEKWLDSQPKEEPKINELINSELGSSVRIRKPGKEDLNYSSGKTIVHKPEREAMTPEWKKVAREFQRNRDPEAKLKNIFISSNQNTGKDTAKSASSRRTLDTLGIERDRNLDQTNSVSSTFSTPMMSANAQNVISSPVSKVKLSQLENLLNQEGRDKPDDYLLKVPNPESPLKLFGDSYNTFTKGKLTDLLQKINSRAPTQARDYTEDDISPDEEYHDEEEKEEEVDHVPKLNIKDFTKSGAYTEENFLENANNIFNNLQKRGFNRSIYKSKSEDFPNEMQLDHTTTTSTPKNGNVKINKIGPENEDLSFTGDSEDEEIEASDLTHSSEDTSRNENISLRYSQEKVKPYNNQESENFLQSVLRAEKSHDDNSQFPGASSYTFDEETKNHDTLKAENDTKVSSTVEASNQSSLRNMNSRIKRLEAKLESTKIENSDGKVKQLLAENTKLKKVLAEWLENKTLTEIDDSASEKNVSEKADKFIKWKPASQLRLPKGQIHVAPKQHPSSVLKGNVGPENAFPLIYDNMVFDPQRQKWVTNREDQEYSDDLGSIEDLEVTSKQSKEDMKGSDAEINETRTKEEKDDKLEGQNDDVSFDLYPGKTLMQSAGEDITHISHLDDISFTQTEKQIVSVLTDILSIRENDNNWENRRDVSLANSKLTSIKNLDKYLPKLRHVDLSCNEVKFLTGLPRDVLTLNLSENAVDNMTLFTEYKDLQYLNLASNKMTHVLSLQANIHLGTLIASNNQIVSVEGIHFLENLTKLNLDQNNLKGELDLKLFNFRNLQELDVSENNIKSIINIEYLPKLRILNANENHISLINCNAKHTLLKKLLLKANNLLNIEFEMFPHLKCLRIDGNKFTSLDFRKLKCLEELSYKCQYSMHTWDAVVNGASDIHTLDISGNASYLSSASFIEPSNRFLNLNCLNLSAMGLKELPLHFGECFPNIRDLNLNFNKIDSIRSLELLENLRKLYMVSNCIEEIGAFAENLRKARTSLRVLDLRLNPVNITLYPYVFNAHELDVAQFHNFNEGAPICLENLDDIESFSIHYQALVKNSDDWTQRDTHFLSSLQSLDSTKAKHRLIYEAVFVNYFMNLRKFDGNVITNSKRKEHSGRIMEDSPLLS